MLSKKSQTDLGMSNSTFWRKYEWCWHVAPALPEVEKHYPVIIIDGIFIGNYCCLIARMPDKVLAKRWCNYESSANWLKLFKRMKQPVVVVSDGQKGILKAIKFCWKDTQIQRCLVHVQRNIKVKLILHPDTDAGRTLLKLSRYLLKIKTTEHATIWLKWLQGWYSKHMDMVNEKTYNDNYVLGSSSKKWWYTHQRLRSAYKQLEKLANTNQMFTFLNKSLLTEIRKYDNSFKSISRDSCLC